MEKLKNGEKSIPERFNLTLDNPLAKIKPSKGFFIYNQRIMTLAIIKTGGKQYRIKEGDSIKVEKLSGSPNGEASKKGDKVEFDQVLLTAKDKSIKLGKPILKSAKVTATIEEQGRSKKVTGVKFKAKKRYKRTFGHRQAYTEVKINKITA